MVTEKAKKATKRETKRAPRSGKELVSREGEGLLFSEETAIYLLDDSGSMRDSMSYGLGISKIAALRDALSVMMAVRNEYPSTDRLGMVHYGGSAGWLIEPEQYSEQHRIVLNKLNAEGGTPMLAAIKLAATSIIHFNGMLRMVIISDGEPNNGGDKNEVFDACVTLYNELGVITDTVGIGIPGVTSSFDESWLAKVANYSGGQYFPAGDKEELRKLLTRMARERGMLLGQGIRQLPAMPGGSY